jgi:hypothetical protein
MMDERIDQRTGPVAGAGMNDEAGWLAKHDQVVVFVEHVERDVFALRLRIFRFGQVDLEDIAGMDLLLRFGHRLAVDRHRSLCDQALDPVAGEFTRKCVRQEGIQASRGILARRQDFPIGRRLFKGVVHSVQIRKKANHDRNRAR